MEIDTELSDGHHILPGIWRDIRTLQLWRIFDVYDIRIYRAADRRRITGRILRTASANDRNTEAQQKDVAGRDCNFDGRKYLYRGIGNLWHE